MGPAVEAPRAGPPPGCCGPLVLAPAPGGFIGPPGPPAPKPPVAGADVDAAADPNKPPVAGAVVDVVADPNKPPEAGAVVDAADVVVGGPDPNKPPAAGAVVDAVDVDAGWLAPNRPPVGAGAVVVGADEVELVLAGGFPKLPKRLLLGADAVVGAAVEVLGAVLLAPPRPNSPPVAGVEVGFPNRPEGVVAGAVVEDCVLGVLAEGVLAPPNINDGFGVAAAVVEGFGWPELAGLLEVGLLRPANIPPPPLILGAPPLEPNSPEFRGGRFWAGFEPPPNNVDEDCPTVPPNRLDEGAWLFDGGGPAGVVEFMKPPNGLEAAGVVEPAGADVVAPPNTFEVFPGVELFWPKRLLVNELEPPAGCWKRPPLAPPLALLAGGLENGLPPAGGLPTLPPNMDGVDDPDPAFDPAFAPPPNTDGAPPVVAVFPNIGGFELCNPPKSPVDAGRPGLDAPVLGVEEPLPLAPPNVNPDMFAVAGGRLLTERSSKEKVRAHPKKVRETHTI